MFCFLYFLQKICVADGIKYVVSPYESDAQIAHILSILVVPILQSLRILTCWFMVAKRFV